MSEYLPTRWGELRSSRAVTRQLRGIEDRAVVQVAAVRGRQVAAMAKVEAVADTTRLGLENAETLGADFSMRAQRTPSARGLMEPIAVGGVVAMARVVDRLERDLR